MSAIKSRAITDTIKSIVIKWGNHPCDINNGNCESFAYEVQQKNPYVEMFWGDELYDVFPESMDASCHCFMRYENRYYDAEEPEGVRHPVFLPFFFKSATRSEVNFAFQKL